MAGPVHRGVLRNVDRSNYTGDVELDRSNADYITNVPINRGISSSQLVNGRVVAVAETIQHHTKGWIILAILS